MSIYTPSAIEANQKNLTSFRGEEGLISFYREADFAALTNQANARSQMTPVGEYLYYTGIAINDSSVELPSFQSFNSASKNIFAPGYSECTMNITALFTQECSDLNWIAPGHPPLLAYIDYIDSDNSGKKSTGDILDANGNYAQTIVVRQLRRTTRKITGSRGASVTYGVDFVGTTVTELPAGCMDM